MTSLFIQKAKERGYIHQLTDEKGLEQKLSAQKNVPCYIGFDATAPSLHVGSLLPIMLLRLYQKCGHKPIILMGGGTTKVGDPSGKDETRKILHEEDIQSNIENIKKVFGRFITFGDGENDAVIENNAHWLDHLNYISFLRDFGKHFSINRMLQMDSVRLRLEKSSHLSFLEFNYMLLQAYDFVELNKRYGCVLQMGGSDQWGNIVMGIELGRRIHAVDLYGLTTPLLTTSSGQKMGKSQAGAIWLNHEQISAYDYWQYWRNTEDDDVMRFMYLYTDLPKEEITSYKSLSGSEINEAKIRLANAVTALNFDEDQAKKAAKTAMDVFVGGGIAQDLPTITIHDEMGLLHALKELEFVTSTSQARRQVESGAVKIDSVQIHDIKYVLKKENYTQDTLRLSLGKKKIGMIKFH